MIHRHPYATHEAAEAENAGIAHRIEQALIPVIGEIPGAPPDRQPVYVDSTDEAVEVVLRFEHTTDRHDNRRHVPESIAESMVHGAAAIWPGTWEQFYELVQQAWVER